MLTQESLTPVITALGSALGLDYSGWYSPRQTWVSTAQSNIDTYFAMLRQPWIAGAAEARILLSLSYWGKYTHEDRKIEASMRSQIARMPGTFRTYLGQMMAHQYCGFSLIEKWYKIEGRKAAIAGLKWVDPRYVKFSLNKDNELVVTFRKGLLKIEIKDYILLKNQPYFNPGNSPYGVASLERVLPYWEQNRLVMMAMAIAAQRQATPLLVGKTSGGTEQAARDLLAQLETARNSGALVIDALDEIQAIAQQTDGALFVSMLRIIRQGILMTFLIPETVLGQGESGSGDSNLNKGHSAILRMAARAQTETVQEEVIETWLRPVLEFNYGNLEDWGSFAIGRDEPENVPNLINALVGAVEKGVGDAERTAERVAELGGL